MSSHWSAEACVDLGRYPLHRLETPEGQDLVARCHAALAAEGMFNLEGFLQPEAVAAGVAELKPLLAGQSFTHRRRHNIYFRKTVDGLAPDHPALREMETINHTVCADQMGGTLLTALYEWPPLRAFLAAAMQRPALHLMGDDLARVNVMAYRAGEALNWHFDRSEFTTTLLLQAPGEGGDFEYRSDLRSATDPNYQGVARLLAGQDPDVRRLRVTPGTLNVFKGRNTAHRVSPVGGGRERIIAVFSYFEKPGVVFTSEERLGFYGRT